MTTAPDPSPADPDVAPARPGEPDSAPAPSEPDVLPGPQTDPVGDPETESELPS